MELGCCKGEVCNRDGCTGIIDQHEKEGGCSCHINPPCGYCETDTSFCPVCEWSAAEERAEYEKKQDEIYKKQNEYYKKEREEFAEKRELFYKKWRGEIPADKLEIRSESHTHFTMKKFGVFPKGTETYNSLLPKVKGTFGGRFTTHIDEESYKFEYIAYTD